MAAMLEVTLFWCRPHCFCYANQAVLMLTRSIPPDSLPFKGQVTQQTAVKWSTTGMWTNKETLLTTFFLKREKGRKQTMYWTIFAQIKKYFTRSLCATLASGQHCFLVEQTEKIYYLSNYSEKKTQSKLLSSGTGCDYLSSSRLKSKFLNCFSLWLNPQNIYQQY